MPAHSQLPMRWPEAQVQYGIPVQSPKSLHAAPSLPLLLLPPLLVVLELVVPAGHRLR